jgi:hypothetical protein
MKKYYKHVQRFKDEAKCFRCDVNPISCLNWYKKYEKNPCKKNTILKLRREEEV